MTFDEEVLTLIDEHGEEHTFSVLDVLEIEGEEYIILIPVANGEQSDEVVILKLAEDDQGNEVLIHIEDEEWEKVTDAWQDKVGHEN
ncbi:MAG: DUF1292 domain-containing protein [Peptococcaceae bacterium]|nr:DUF1292 domain-containing protein [Peptococcaceae bacterium]